VEAIFKQTGQQLNKKDVELPEITTLGTYTASVRLHPEVVGQFNIMVQREKMTS
jgi:large subunit ribosomal protein L9